MTRIEVNTQKAPSYDDVTIKIDFFGCRLSIRDDDKSIYQL